MSLDAHSTATCWLSAFSSALSCVDIAAVMQLFLQDGWLRDWLVFTWDIRSLDGRDKIAGFLAPTLPAAQIADVRLDTSPEFAPRAVRVHDLQDAETVELVFAFECSRGPARALARLMHDVDGGWRALVVFTQLLDIRGHEELSVLPLRDDLMGIHGRDMRQEFAAYVKEVEAKPHVLVVGGGQTGLHVAARFKQLNIPTLVIEREPRVGDSWRKRYPSLTLHTIKKHHSMLYQPYPSNWPQFTPRDKLADWLETYAINQDLVVWTNSSLQPRPKYNPETAEWDATVLRDGVPVKLRPAHIILATGTLGAPSMPVLPEQELFRGPVLHSAAYGGGTPYAGQRVIVVGAGNSSIDVCQDLVLQGAKEVTMVQRSATCVVSRDKTTEAQMLRYPDSAPLDACDLRTASWPLGLLRRVAIANQQAMWDREKELHDKLRGAGVRLSMGSEGQGQHILVYERLGGYWLDKGGADLIAEGKIKMLVGVSPERFTANGLVMSDGSELSVDAVIFATGYSNIRDVNAALFGTDVISKTSKVWGLDCEGEISGSYRPSGYPGLWFASGDFSISRTLSKILASDNCKNIIAMILIVRQL